MHVACSLLHKQKAALAASSIGSKQHWQQAALAASSIGRMHNFLVFALH
jgi:hypothetical protein